MSKTEVMRQAAVLLALFVPWAASQGTCQAPRAGPLGPMQDPVHWVESCQLSVGVGRKAIDKLGQDWDKRQSYGGLLQLELRPGSLTLFSTQGGIQTIARGSAAVIQCLSKDSLMSRVCINGIVAVVLCAV